MSSIESESGSENEEIPLSRDVEEWCYCHQCVNTQTAREQLCCQTLPEAVNYFDDAINRYNVFEPYTCICEHPGFQAVCLNDYVLEVAWLTYKQQYGAAAYEHENVHKRYRHIAYRQLARFLFGIVGKDNRYVLPACAVEKIRQTFPPPENMEVTGFQFQ